ncbi:MAG: TRM11 family methyltransferase [Candidatus Bathyarchaeia archaeon]|nr:hypothetical protein [Candidatus Bathyarchaeota archaeon]
MARLFFLVSGENPTLPFSEVKSILSAEGYGYHILGELSQLLRVEADAKCAEAVKFRSALARECCLEIFCCGAVVNEIISSAERVDFAEFLSSGETFAVRVFRVRGASPHISCLALERIIGGIIFRGVRDTKVYLKNPNKTFVGILTDNMFFFGLRLAEIKHKDLSERRPRRRVFFHPSALTAKIARCMVNLAQARAGELLLDPFCGTGGILIEAGLIGCRTIGFDIKRFMAEGSMKNLRFFGIEPEALIVADARLPPISPNSVDRIVTDPPYGTAATTMGLTTRELLESFFSSASDIIREGGMMCIAAPKDIRVHEIGQRYGFKHLESHFIYVHRRLTREVAVFRYCGE